MPMGIRVRTLQDGLLEIRDIVGVRRKKDLPKEYLNGYPKVFAWDNRLGISVVRGPHDGAIMQVGQLWDTDTFNDLNELIDRAGNRLHEITVHDPTTRMIWH